MGGGVSLGLGFGVPKAYAIHTVSPSPSGACRLDVNSQLLHHHHAFLPVVILPTMMFKDSRPLKL